MSSPTENAANAAGVAIQNVTIAPNTKVETALNHGIQWLGTTNSKGVKLDIKQAPHALGLTVTKDYISQLGIHSTATGQDDWLTKKATLIKKIKLWRNGVEIPVTEDPASATNAQVVYENTSGKMGVINFKPNATVGDVFTVTIQAGDAPEETYTVKYNATTSPF